MKNLTMTPLFKPLSTEPHLPVQQFRHFAGAGAIALLLISSSVWLSTPPRAIAQFGRERPDFFEQGQQQFEQEIQRLEQQQPDTTPLLTVETTDIQWSPVLMREGGFVVWMPQGTFAQEQRTIETPQRSLEFESISSQSRLGRFVVAFSEEIETSPDDVRETLDRVQNRIITHQMNFEVDNESDTTFNTHPARDFTLTNDEETIFFRLLIGHNRLYVLALSQPNDLASVETRVSFFNSFQLL